MNFVYSENAKTDAMKITDIKPNPNNPRLIKDDRFKKLCKSISEFPQMMALRPIIVDADGVILGGNMRYQALKHNGIKDLPDEWVRRADDLTEDEKKRFIITDNSSFGEYDWEMIANEWSDLPLGDWGLDVPEFEELEAKDAEEDDYEIPDEIQTDIVQGDLIEIGEHRLMCGDSTDSDAVDKLLGGKEPYLMVTDPPYGVVYDADWRNKALRADGSVIGGRAVGKVSNDDNADWTGAWALSPARVAYVWHADRFSSIVQTSIEDCGFVVRCQIIWVKSNFAIGRGDYHWKHEPCWYAVKKGSKGNWAGDRKQTTVWEIAKPSKSETGHSTQKPVECMAKPIANHDGDVYDPFLGSGTTMVAAHQLNRKCYGMELDPKYCQVCVDRMLKLDPTLTLKRNGEAWERNMEEVRDGGN